MKDAADNGVLARFILTEEERNPAVEEVRPCSQANAQSGRARHA